MLTASGAGAASRVAVGLAVVGRMIAATCFSLLFVPSFFVVFQSLGEFWNKPDPETPSGDASVLEADEKQSIASDEERVTEPDDPV